MVEARRRVVEMITCTVCNIKAVIECDSLVIDGINFFDCCTDLSHKIAYGRSVGRLDYRLVRRFRMNYVLLHLSDRT